jgi:hypothetical protein
LEIKNLRDEYLLENSKAYYVCKGKSRQHEGAEKLMPTYSLAYVPLASTSTVTTDLETTAPIQGHPTTWF